MRLAYSAKELASMALSGLPKTARNISIRAEQEGWPFFWEKVRGGQRKMYRAHLLPDYVRQAILAQEEIDALVPTGRPSARPATRTMVSQTEQKRAMHKADLLRLYLQAMAAAPWGGKAQARADFMTAYNSGIAYPEIFAVLGKLSWKTIEGWKRKLKKNGGDTFDLADRRGVHKRGKRGLTTEQTDILLRCALHPNKPRISEAIRMAHAVMQTKGIPNTKSDATYRRWLNDWIKRNYHIWVFNRSGAKAWNDKCAFYLERDYSLINVGDVVVADGHVLNFEILNPWTGKPKRMALILWLDMRSNFPLGWEIMPTEDTAAISSALRRAILRLGKYPQVAYLDNGKAFRSRFFRGCNFEEAGFAGLYERLGMKTIFAWPYHGQSKTVERFFGSFAELERWCPTYTGTSIENKPPRMHRGEKLHRKVHEKAFGDYVLTMEQAHAAIAAWFDVYVNRPQRGHLNGKTPLEVFEAGRGPGVDKAELTYLMMSLEVKHIRRNGISLAGRNYYDPALYGRRHPVLIRYDLQDRSAIYVFDQDGSFICEARPVEKVHPAATVLGTDRDRDKLRRHIEYKKRQEKEASASARAFLEQEIIPEHQRRLATIGLLPESGERQAKPGVVHKLEETTSQAIDEAWDNLDQVMAEGQEFARKQLHQEIDSLAEPERYERLLTMQMQGEELLPKWRDFVVWYEQTPEYLSNQEYYADLREKLAILHQMQA